MKINNLRDIFIVTKFTMRDMLSRKSFRISTIIIAILIVFGFSLPSIIADFQNGNNTETILISDPSDLFTPEIEDAIHTNVEHNNAPYRLEFTNDNLDSIKEKINHDETTSAIIISKTDDIVHFDCYIKNLSTFTNTENLNNVVEQLKSIYTNQQIDSLHLSAAQLAKIHPTFSANFNQTDNQKITGNVFVTMLLSLVLFYAIYFCAFQVSSSVTTEKTSKIIETLVTSTSPSSIILGKTIGIGLVGLFQMALFIIIAIISTHVFLDPELLRTLIDFSNITPLLGLILVVYFLLGYTLFALLYALTGSTVSKPEDIQSANAPIAILSLIGFYLAFFTLQNPTSDLNIFAAIFPVSSPFCMPLRVMLGIATPLEILTSILMLVITILIIVRIAIKIYSSAILNYGTKPSLKQFFKKQN